MRILILLFLWLSTLPVWASDGALWMQRFSEADQKYSYQGTFVYERSGAFSSHNLWHKVEADGSQRDRLVQADGPFQEVLKISGVTQCVAGAMADSGTAPWPVRKLNSKELSAWYDMRLAGKTRVAGRSAVVLTLQPRDKHRYGMELYLDEETALPLKSLLLNEKAQVIERLQFTHIQLQAPDDAALQSSANCRPSKHVAVSSSPAAWQAAWLPGGFVLSQTQQQPSVVKGVAVFSQFYTDGLARFSVFIEPLQGARAEDARAQLGPTSVVSRRLVSADGGVMVTVVGEIPSGTAERIALSMRPLNSAHD